MYRLFLLYGSPLPEPWRGNEIDLNNFSVDFGLGTGTYIFVGQVLPVNEVKLIENQIEIFTNPIKTQ